MFSTKGQEVKSGGGLAKSIQPGVSKAHIYSSIVRTSNNGEKKCLQFIMETPAIKVDGFEGWNIDRNNDNAGKFKGQSSTVTASMWTEQFNSSDINKNDILNKMIIIAKELGLRDKIDKLSNDKNIDSIEKWVEAATDILKNEDLYFFFKGTEEEYNGKTIVKLSLPKYKFCSQDPEKLDKYDKNNKYHFKPLATKPVDNFAVNDFETISEQTAKDDLPFNV